MVHRTVRLAYIIVIPISLCLAFALQLYLEQVIAADKNPAILTLRGQPDTPSSEIYQKIEEFSTQRQIQVGRLVDRLDSSGSSSGLSRELFVTTGSQIGQKYRSFDPAYPTTVRQFSELGQMSASGTYLVYGDLVEARRLATLISQLDYSTVVDPPLTTATILTQSDKSAPGAIIAVLAVLCLLVIAGELSSTKRYGISRLHGASLKTVLAKELGSVGKSALKLTLVVLTLAVPTLLIYNNLSQLDNLLLNAGFFVLAAWSVILITHLCCATLTFFLVDLIAAIKGKLRGIPVLAIYYAVRIPLLAVLIITLVQTALLLHNNRQADTERAHWESAAQLQNLNFSPTLTSGNRQAEKKFFDTVGSWITQNEKEGKLVLAFKKEYNIPGEKTQGRLLLVNQAYLDRFDIVLATGEKLTASPSVIKFGIPEKLSADKQNIANEISASIEIALRDDQNLPVSLETLQNDQKIFIPGKTDESGRRYESSLREDTLIAVMPQNALNSSELVSAATRGEVLFTDPASLESSLKAAPEVDRYIGSFTSIATGFTESYAAANRKIATSTLLAALLLAPLFATSLGLCSVYRNVRRNESRVKFLMGWSFPRIFIRAISFETACWIVIAGYTLIQARDIYTRGASGMHYGASSPEQQVLLGSYLPIALATTFTLSTILLILSFSNIARKVRNGQ